MTEYYKKAVPRLLLAAGASGSGKTLITCGILQALMDRSLRTVSFKCGPDYIDPMFHSMVIGTKARNLDTFFLDDETARYFFLRSAADMDIAVIEGVMGYYDGLGGTQLKASTYDIARITDTPVILIVNCRGMSLSVIPFIQGFVNYKEDSRIRGVILNRVSAVLYPVLRQKIEEELKIRVFGYVPEMDDLKLESRHLGLVLPGEVDALSQKLKHFAAALEETLDIDAMLRLAGSSGELEGKAPELQCGLFADENDRKREEGTECRVPLRPLRIGIARDEAFCFLYEENLELLRFYGAELVCFSPLHDTHLPDVDGLLLPGGYPELFCEQLSRNVTMREEIREAICGGMPTLAECGGFLYLQRELEDINGISWPMAGVLEGRSWKTQKAVRFGYITLTARQDQMLGMDIGEIRGHEFHYYDSSADGEAFEARKSTGKRSWRCMQGSRTMVAGFPHLYYYSNLKVPAVFVRACRKYACRKSE